MGRVRGARATTQQTEGDTSEGEPTAAESDHSVSDADSDATQSEQTQGQSTQGHRLYDVLAALGRRPQQESLHQRPSVALDRGREEVTSHRSLAGPQQQQLVEPRP